MSNVLSLTQCEEGLLGNPGLDKYALWVKLREKVLLA